MYSFFLFVFFFYTDFGFYSSESRRAAVPARPDLNSVVGVKALKLSFFYNCVLGLGRITYFSDGYFILEKYDRECVLPFSSMCSGSPIPQLSFKPSVSDQAAAHGQHKPRRYKSVGNTNMLGWNMNRPGAVSFCLTDLMNRIISTRLSGRRFKVFIRKRTSFPVFFLFLFVSLSVLPSSFFSPLSHVFISLSQASSYYPRLPCAHSPLLLQP